MLPLRDENSVWLPDTEEEKEAVRQQMNRLLQTSHFRNSRRYPALFRFIVEETLEGRGEHLKERLLGVQVFGRPADYDTASDPIVRVTIAEIRKRIAQYYHEEAHESEMRIELLPGRYEPEFRPRKGSVPDPIVIPPEIDAPAADAVEELAAGAPDASRHPRSRRTSFLLWTAAVIVLVVAASLGAAWWFTRPTALDELWAPLLSSHQPITFCMPLAGTDSKMIDIAAGVIPNDQSGPGAAAQSPRTPSFLDYETSGENVVFSDALATLRISNVLYAHHHDLRYRISPSSTLDDLRHGPNVLIGGLDNQWTLQALAPLRYRFSGFDKHQFWILDTKNPTKKDWLLDLRGQLVGVKRDYALIARIHDDATGQVEVVVAGIGMSGTAAAGEFLIDPAQAEELRRKIGPGFRDHDFEAVLSTDVVDGVAGPPKILTTVVW